MLLHREFMLKPSESQAERETKSDQHRLFQVGAVDVRHPLGNTEWVLISLGSNPLLEQVTITLKHRTALESAWGRWLQAGGA